MIYFDELNTTIIVPKVMEASPDTIVFEHQVTHAVISIDVIDSSDWNKIYYKFELTDVEDFIDGQYDYKVMSDDTVIARGIAQFGHYVPESTNYNSNKTIIQYER